MGSRKFVGRSGIILGFQLVMTKKSIVSIGDRFGDWEVLEKLPKARALCFCRICKDTIREVRNYALARGDSTSCGCYRARANTKKASIRVGVRFGRWVVCEEPSASRKIGCQCDCGTVRQVDYVSLLSGDSPSCGCSGKERFKNSNPRLDSAINDKIKTTMFQKYGAKDALSSPYVRSKIAQTNLEKFGVESPLQSEEILEKTRETQRRKYGVSHFMQSPLFLERAHGTLAANGTVNTSRPQLKLYEIVKGVYENAELNHPVSRVFLDIALFVQGQKIAIEYDGGGHFRWEDENIKRQKDYARDVFIKARGYKVLRIESKNDILPTMEEVQEYLEELITTKRTFKHFIIGEKK